jgi:UDP-3-O-[3-hydroxymyristoyl] glucosamine N-acyltransferase
VERNIESILSELGIDYRFYRNTESKKTFRNVTTIQQGKEEDLCYCSFDGEEAISLISKSNAGIILCKRSLEDSINQGQNQQLPSKQQIILVDNPRAAFIRIINKIYPKRVETGTSSTAIISESATIGSDCYIGNNVTIGKNVVLVTIL